MENAALQRVEMPVADDVPETCEAPLRWPKARKGVPAPGDWAIFPPHIPVETRARSVEEPSPLVPRGMRLCPECMTPFRGHIMRIFCTEAHKRAWNNRQLGRGAPLVTLAMAWRQGKDVARADKGTPSEKAKARKEVAKLAFIDFCNELDRLAQEDRAAGRLPALTIVEDRARRGVLSIRDVRNNLEFERNRESGK